MADKPTRPSWMGPKHYEILRFLHEVKFGKDRIKATPMMIGANADVAQGTVQTYLPELERHGLVEKLEMGRGVYRITGLGEAWMDGHIDVGQIENQEE